MGTAVDTFATVILLILLILFITHLINGTASAWISSKFRVATG